MPSIMDMKTTIGSYGATEFHLLVAAASEMADYYELPFYGTAGCTDAKTLDEQAVTEATMEIFSTIFYLKIDQSDDHFFYANSRQDHQHADHQKK